MQPNNGPISVTLTIELQPDGKVGVTGPIDNKVLCYGMLEAARDAIKDFNDKKRMPTVELPNQQAVSLFGKQT